MTDNPSSAQSIFAMMRITLLALLALFLTGCDVIKERMGIKDPAKVEAEAKAIGASCRLSGRSLEDCYNLNDYYPRAPIYVGWKEMNEYMAERKMVNQPPKLGKDGKPLAHETGAQMAMKDTKDDAKASSKEADKDVKTEAGKETIKDIRPKKPDLAKEVTSH